MPQPISTGKSITKELLHRQQEQRESHLAEHSTHRDGNLLRLQSFWHLLPNLVLGTGPKVGPDPQ